ncbi:MULTISPECIES: GNAT family N-acetyltransferase [Aerococcus]|uniref:GNAT family N-acetyltransferase n=1 Tax=Aerococcus sanguinicola TaxID=119206 RepID=A0A5N1GMG9_9LACT|nr:MULTISPECIES: GNAT family N-acetyltransferase [Aerococcus]KAA9302167.1 GNAT family N-acetyltransferase [Aerococcus sanguinicola]MDK6368403.1 GNAT family N-acetyltransferase [Aerococcus sp. UMB9870]MDK6679485.1 GNAT family N-acetyltransferase [Aerococcus sp. UMB8608]MDK6686329.1 GNAT family N-acetyltransferase [Aerococcus sp. UMB8623]MDK6941050.1 GNAT family N-acetyltransferase [Aerococcus sp. UMB8487]
MESLAYRKANLEDLDAIESILAASIQYLADQGVDQWQNGEVTIAHIRSAIEADQAYVFLGEGGEILAFLVLADEDPAYDHLASGAWQTEPPYYAIHRVMISLDQRGKGLSQALFQTVKALARAAGKRSLRVDTHPDNRVMQHILEREGFCRTGSTYLSNGGFRWTYDYALI